MPLELWSQRLCRYQYLQGLICGRRVLEVGCGTGEGAFFLAQTAARVVSVDSSARLIAAAQQRYRRKNLSFQLCDPLDLKQKAGAVDWVIVPELDFWVARSALVAQIKRVLTQSGAAALFVRARHSGAEGAGLSYAELSSYAQAAFRQVTLVAELPFTGVTYAEFDGEPEALPALDGSLVAEDPPPVCYLALCSDDQRQTAGYSVIQIPSAASAAPELDELSARVAEERARAAALAERILALEAEAQLHHWRRDELDGWKQAAERHQREAARAKAQLALAAEGRAGQSQPRKRR